MLDSISPLQAIHQKETELRQRIELARQQAEARVQSARAKAEQLLAQAEREGRAEAKVLFDEGLTAAQQEAESIVVGAQEQAAALHRRAVTQVDVAAGQIAGLVLPEVSRPA